LAKSNLFLYFQSAKSAIANFQHLIAAAVRS